MIFGEPLRKQAVVPEHQCANGNHCLINEAALSECQCAKVITICAQFSQKYKSAHCDTQKGGHSDNDRQNLVSANFGLTVCKRGLTIFEIVLTIYEW